jgi:hypothetical protein
MTDQELCRGVDEAWLSVLGAGERAFTVRADGQWVRVTFHGPRGASRMELEFSPGSARQFADRLRAAGEAAAAVVNARQRELEVRQLLEADAAEPILPVPLRPGWRAGS